MAAGWRNGLFRSVAWACSRAQSSSKALAGPRRAFRFDEIQNGHQSNQSPTGQSQCTLLWCELSERRSLTRGEASACPNTNANFGKQRQPDALRRRHHRQRYALPSLALLTHRRQRYSHLMRPQHLLIAPGRHFHRSRPFRSQHGRSCQSFVLLWIQLSLVQEAVELRDGDSPSTSGKASHIACCGTS
jgi:hypothetical protein